MMTKNLYLILLLIISNFYFGQESFKSIIQKYNDSISAKNYGLVGLYKKNDKVEKTAIGFAFTGEKMTIDKVFNIGSLSKTFTAVLTLQEVEKGTIKLSDSLKDYFPPELCRNNNVNLNITIEQLLRHKSGLGEVVTDSLVNDAFSNPYFEYNYAFLFNKIPKPISTPNTEYKYCNTNYLLLGYILEVINDKPYSEILKERIFIPCNMINSYSYYSKNIKNVAHPILNNEDLSERGFFKYYQSYAFSAGGISSNLDDLNKFFTKLYNYKLISKKIFDKMIHFGGDKYGLGIEKYIIKNEIYYGHSGDNISFKVRNYYNPRTKELYILMANQYKDLYTMKIASEIFKP